MLEVVRWGAGFFADKGVESPRLNIELIICATLKCERVYIYTNFDKPLNADELVEIKKMSLRRAKHEPLQYIIGKTSFIGLDILVDNSVLIPRPETEQMAQAIVDDYKNTETGLNIFEIGSGSGCISLYLAKSLPNATVYGVDIDKAAIETAKKNKAALGIENVDFFAFDILNKIPTKTKFDIVVSNPPYIPYSDYAALEADVLREPKIALTDGSDGLTFYRRFSQIFDNMIADKGKFYLENGMGQAQAIKKLFADSSFEIVVGKDFAGVERFIFGSKM